LLICCVTVTDGGAWSPAERIEEQTDPTPVRVAADASGTSIAVWGSASFGPGSIWARHHTPGAGWDSIRQIDGNEEDAHSPALAVDPNGNAVVVWTQEAEIGVGGDIWANRYTAGGGWGAATRLDTDEAGDAGNPHVAVDSFDNAVAVWHQSDGIRENIWANRSTLGGGWSIPQLIEADDAGHAGDPRIAMNPDGDAIAVWHQSDGTRANIWANRYAPGSGWRAAERIESKDDGEARLPHVAIDPNGNAMVVWHQSDGARFDVWANRYTPGNGWETAVRIDGDDTGDADSADVGLDADGHAIAVWKQFDGISVGIWANRYTPDEGWGTAERLEANDEGDALGPEIAVSANGDAVVVWLQSDGLRLDIWSNSYTLTEGWMTAAPIDRRREDRKEPRRAAVAADPNGNAITVWSTEGQQAWSARRE